MRLSSKFSGPMKQKLEVRQSKSTGRKHDLIVESKTKYEILQKKSETNPWKSSVKIRNNSARNRNFDAAFQQAFFKAVNHLDCNCCILNRILQELYCGPCRFCKFLSFFCHASNFRGPRSLSAHWGSKVLSGRHIHTTQTPLSIHVHTPEKSRVCRSTFALFFLFVFLEPYLCYLLQCNSQHCN